MPSASSAQSKLPGESAATIDPDHFLARDELWVWGVDYSTTDITIGMRTIGAWCVQNVSIPYCEQHNYSKKNALLYDATYTLVATEREVHTPAFVYIEEPSKNRWVIGAHAIVKAAFWQALNHHAPHETSVWDVNSQLWKKCVLDRAPVTSEDSKKLSTTWANANFKPEEPFTHDQADALAIAQYGFLDALEAGAESR